MSCGGAGRRGRTEAAPVRGRCQPGLAAHQGAQIARRAQAALPGDDVEAGLAAFDQPAGEGEPFAGEPGQRGGVRLGAEAASR
ncbi:hypothetical protein GCM10010211_25690 [Streptomyces albospinus]|uniref:Uncharacterized protein n=1 Tax=Streptomyces albospinus TaxID=285515 RepID=A0ABQ2V0Q0_9ACTN|nr:hypothetical protein GCM10010211_25690 [Streptomyces albospinus]